MKNKKLLATLASTAGLAAAIAPAVCLTSCGQKSHLSVSGVSVEKTKFNATWTYPSWKQGDTVMILGMYYVVTHNGVRTPEPLDTDVQGGTADYFGTISESGGKFDDSLTFAGGSQPQPGDKVDLVCFAWCISTGDSHAWDEFVTLSATVPSV